MVSVGMIPEWLAVAAGGLVAASVLMVAVTMAGLAVQGVLVLLQHPAAWRRHRRRRSVPRAAAGECQDRR